MTKLQSLSASIVVGTAAALAYAASGAIIAGAIAGCLYGAPGNPIAIGEQAEAMRVASMWAARLERAVDGGACNPSLPLTVGEDIAGPQADAWLAHARSIDTLK